MENSSASTFARAKGKHPEVGRLERAVTARPAGSAKRISISRGTRRLRGTSPGSRYRGAESAADLAICNLLAFYTRHDADQMDRLFRQSGLMRDKWDSRRNDSTYGRDTMARAIRDGRETYTPAAETIELETDETDAETVCRRGSRRRQRTFRSAPTDVPPEPLPS